MAQVITIHGRLEWRAVEGETAGQWIGICDALNVSMEADSLDELRSVIGETIHELLLDLLEDDELESFLAARGWTSTTSTVADGDDLSFDVPWEVIVQGAQNDSARHCH